MKRLKIFITIDIWAQSILLLAIVICSFLPVGFFGTMVFFAIIGAWQVISSIIWVWTFKDKKRLPYFILVTILYGVILLIIQTYYPNWLDTVGIIYTIFNPILLGLWYYIITWQDFIKIRKTKLR